MADRPATTFGRALLAFLALPGVVGFLVPLLLASGGPSRGVVVWPGVLVVLAGIFLLLWCVRDFYVAGKGTLAPWDPPRRLVVVGLYRHVRNPMYVAVLTLVVGWAVLFWSGSVAVYALLLAIGFHVRVLVAEEPWLRAQFGDGWQRYRAHVRRWLPRLAPWTDDLPPDGRSTTGAAVDSASTGYRVVPARLSDVHALPAIELAAARLLAGHAPESVLTETTHETDLRHAQADGRLWVALVGERPVGFALVEELSPARAHLEEVDVLPAYGRRGIGGALVRAARDGAVQSGHAEVTLTTFRELPWNMPFYAKLGFAEVRPDELDAELEAIVEEEAARGLERGRRVVMRWVPHRGGAGAC